MGFSKWFNQNERTLKKIYKIVGKINALEQEFEQLSDEELQQKTAAFKQRYQNGETLDHLLPEAFATVREAGKRVLGMRHYDVQLVGGIALHQGQISEMKTGEGKTLVSTLPAYLNALTGKGVHIVTVNEYLAQRDAEEMGAIHRFLGLTVGVNLNDMNPFEKNEVYQCDITYGTNSEFGFDYLRDNMVGSPEEMVQKPLYFAIIDEVDSILIDEARTPLIISGSLGSTTDLYPLAAQIIGKLKKQTHYVVDAKEKNATLTPDGITKIEKSAGIDNLYDPEHSILNHHIQQALQAKAIMKKDVDYVVRDGKILIVDEFTGRIMDGRRFSAGLHQAIEAKEGVEIQNESKTLASITLQNYFRMYEKLAGMTGTAKTEEEEFRKIYKLNVLVIPTNLPVARKDLPDLIYKTQEAKFQAVVSEIEKKHKNGQPVLVGTTSIENSELLSSILTKKGLMHTVLNAKNHEKEAEIVAAAGQANAITIATNMAGRGTDIKLGENVRELGGLHIIGTERHESRRIDNQLRGRAGRQGDAGSSQFIISLEDDLMRRFGSDSLKAMMTRMGMADDEAIESRMVTRAIESAQKRVENNNFDIRKNVLKYDDVINQQRKLIYEQRQDVLRSIQLKEHVTAMIESAAIRLAESFCVKEEIPEDWDAKGLIETVERVLLKPGSLSEGDIRQREPEEVEELLVDLALSFYKEREETFGEEAMRHLERTFLLRTVDDNWMEHIDTMDQLRKSIHLRAYAQTDPLREYEFEAFELFGKMIENIEDQVTFMVLKTEIILEKA